MKARSIPRLDITMIVLSTLLIVALVGFAIIGFIMIVLALLWWPVSIAIAVTLFVVELLKFIVEIVWTP